MKSLILFLLAVLSMGLSGCLSFHSETTPAPKETSEKIIVVPDTTDRKIKVVPEKSY